MSPEPDEVPEAEWRPIFDRLGELLDQVAVALKGPTPPLTSWGYDDLPALAAEAARARDEVRSTLADLVNSTTIADRLGVSRTAVGMWHERGTAGFPAPLDVPGVTVPLYSWAEVAAWDAERRGRRAEGDEG